MTAEADLLAGFEPLARRVAGSFLRRLPRGFSDLEDLVNVCRVAALLATRRGENEPGRVAQAMRWAIQDELRDRDWLSRRERKRGGVQIMHFTEEFEQDWLPSVHPSAEDLVAEKELILLVRAAVGNLEPRRALVVESVARGEKHEVIAKRLGVSTVRVCQLLKDAREQLRAALSPAPHRGRALGSMNVKTRKALAMVRKLHAEGKSLREIAVAVGLSRCTIGKYVERRTISDAMRKKHVQWKERGVVVVPPWVRKRAA